MKKERGKKKMFDMKLRAENVEVRGHEKKVSAQGKEYIIVNVEDGRGKPSELYDPNVGNAGLYIRGAVGTFLLNVSIGRFSKVSVDTFVPIV